VSIEHAIAKALYDLRVQTGQRPQPGNIIEMHPDTIREIAERHHVACGTPLSVPTSVSIGGVDVYPSTGVEPGTFRWARETAEGWRS
jgi:hypothetical protein